jgi:predicted Kef-type K+ transport protein
MLKVVFLMALALHIEAGLFLWLTYFKLRSQTAFLLALSLVNYSEFGLIVCSVSVSYGLLENNGSSLWQYPLRYPSFFQVLLILKLMNYTDVGIN